MLLQAVKVWALYLLQTDAFADRNTALYFFMVTYPMLGSGDVVLGPDFRVFATFAFVMARLVFGLSTAFSVDLVSWVLLDCQGQ